MCRAAKTVAAANVATIINTDGFGRTHICSRKVTEDPCIDSAVRLDSAFCDL